MSAPVDDLEQRVQDASDELMEIMPAAITLAMMFRHRNMSSWFRTEFEGYGEGAVLPDFRRDVLGHIVARSPQYGWIPAPVNDKQKLEHGHRDVLDGVKTLERFCMKCKKGSGQQIAFAPDQMLAIQAQINLSAELAITVSRESYVDVLRVIRSAIYLWARELTELGFSGEHNSFNDSDRTKASHLDDPERFWREAMTQAPSLPIPGVRTSGFLERVFGRAS